MLYKYNYIARNIYPKDLLGFRLELVHVLSKVVGLKSGSTVQKKMRCNAQGDRMCELERVTKIGLKKGRCHHCQLTKRTPVHSTSFGCTVCLVRLCKTPCFGEFHSHST